MIKSIKLRTWLYMMGIVSVVLLIMWLLGVIFLQSFYEYNKELDVKKVQNEIVKTLSDKDIYEAYEQLLGVSRENDLFIEIYDKNATLLISPFMYIKGLNNEFSMNNMMTTIATSKIIKEMIDYGQSSRVVKFVGEKGNQRSSITLINKLNSDTGVYFIASRTNLMPIQATADIISRLFTILFVLVIIVSVALAFTFAGTVTKPIKRISIGAKQVASGNYNVVLPVTSKDEIGTLTSDFNEMTKELGKVDSVRKDLIANVSHELRTPLTMIKGYAETIRDLSGNNPEKREKQLDIIIDETDRLSHLITNMLDLSQLQAGKIEFQKENFNLSKMLTKLLERYDIFKEQGYTFNFDIAEDIYVFADYSRIEQVICNLVDNAVNHSIETKTIDISLDENKRFNVRNFGDIIDEENIKHIFDRYYKIDKTGNRRIAGTGIGLSIVKEILAKHNFKFGVTSNEVDGTNFWVNFQQI